MMNLTKFKDEAILGNKIKTNKLLTETEFDNEKNDYYLNFNKSKTSKIKRN